MTDGIASESGFLNAGSFAAFVKAFREYFGLSQGDLSAIMCVTTRQIKHYEADKRQPLVKACIGLQGFLQDQIEALANRLDRVPRSFLPEDISAEYDRILSTLDRNGVEMEAFGEKAKTSPAMGECFCDALQKDIEYRWKFICLLKRMETHINKDGDDHEKEEQ